MTRGVDVESGIGGYVRLDFAKACRKRSKSSSISNDEKREKRVSDDMMCVLVEF